MYDKSRPAPSSQPNAESPDNSFIRVKEGVFAALLSQTWTSSPSQLLHCCLRLQVIALQTIWLIWAPTSDAITQFHASVSYRSGHWQQIKTMMLKLRRYVIKNIWCLCVITDSKIKKILYKLFWWINIIYNKAFWISVYGGFVYTCMFLKIISMLEELNKPSWNLNEWFSCLYKQRIKGTKTALCKKKYPVNLQ